MHTKTKRYILVLLFDVCLLLFTVDDFVVIGCVCFVVDECGADVDARVAC